jgi:hypothetical protein
MIIRTTTDLPPVFALIFMYREIIDTRNSAAHVSFIVKFPILVSVCAIPLTRIVVPFVGKTNGDAVAIVCPQFLDEAIV